MAGLAGRTTRWTRKPAWPNARRWASARRCFLLHLVNSTERERDIIEARRLRDEPATLEELSQKYDVSRERVRQIEMRAFDKLQTAMRTALTTKRSHTLEATS